MKHLLYICVTIFIFSCSKKYDMDTPIIEENFNDFFRKINNLCLNIDEETCKNIKGLIILELPNAVNSNYTPIAGDIEKANIIFRKLNGKTPSEMIQLYKNTLIKNLDVVRKRDLDIKKNLDLIYDSYENTKKYASYISVSDIKLINSNNVSNMKIQFTITNNTDFDITQLVGEVEFYSNSDILLGRTKGFLKELTPLLHSKRKTTITIPLSSISKSDLSMIRAAINIKIKVTVSSVTTTSLNDSEKNLILSLPYSYYRMRELLEESEKVYNDTLNKINKIKIN